MKPTAAYLVVASQRCGSTLLTESLRSTGVAGQPEEFFHFLPDTGRSPQPADWYAGQPEILRLLPPRCSGTPDTFTPEQWRHAIRAQGMTSNGVWGGKLMFNQVPLLLNRAAALPDSTGPGLKAALRDVIGVDPVLIHVHRPDVVEQAVSFWRAIQTGVWRSGGTPRGSALYHRDAIRHAVEMLSAQERGWRAWFTAEGAPQYSIAYPALWRNLTFFCGTILDALGLDPALAPPPALTKQGDAENTSWATRYRAETLAVLA